MKSPCFELVLVTFHMVDVDYQISIFASEVPVVIEKHEFFTQISDSSLCCSLIHQRLKSGDCTGNELFVFIKVEWLHFFVDLCFLASNI